MKGCSSITNESIICIVRKHCRYDDEHTSGLRLSNVYFLQHLSRLSRNGRQISPTDTLARGRSFRTLNVVDSYSRECLAIEVDTSLPGARVIHVLERLVAEHGVPKRLRVDNGPEFVG